MNPCIFCKIVKKEIPAHVVYEDEKFLAFLDVRPLSPGHTLIIPKTHYRFVWDVPELEYFGVAKKVAQALQKIHGEAVFSKIIGEEIPHAHIWVYPDPEKAKGDKNDLVANAAALKEKLSV